MNLAERAARLAVALEQIRRAGNDSHPTAMWMQRVAAHALEPTKWPHPGEQHNSERMISLRARLDEYCHERRGSGVDDVEIGNFLDWLERPCGDEQ